MTTPWQSGFGFSGGLVPGVDVMAYMMHQPVAKWGRAFLERGLIEARFVKPVYDGEMAELTADESNGVLSIEVHSRGELCATGTASLPASAPAVSIADYRRVAAVAERRPVNAASYEVGKWLGTTPLDWAGGAASEYLADIQGNRPDLREGGPRSSRPAATGDEPGAGRQRHFGAVDSRRQPHAAACRLRRPATSSPPAQKSIGNYDKKGHRFVELDALVVGNGQTPLAHCHHIAIYQPREQAAA